MYKTTGARRGAREKKTQHKGARRVEEEPLKGEDSECCHTRGREEGVEVARVKYNKYRNSLFFPLSCRARERAALASPVRI